MTPPACLPSPACLFSAQPSPLPGLLCLAHLHYVCCQSPVLTGIGERVKNGERAFPPSPSYRKFSVQSSWGAAPGSASAGQSRPPPAVLVCDPGPAVGQGLP